MIRARSIRMVVAVAIVATTLVAQPAAAHPWHRHPGDEAGRRADASPADPDRAGRASADAPFIMTAARRPTAGVDIADAFAAHEKLGRISTRRDDRWFLVESDGMPDHPLMVGIRTWQQQVPLPQKYTGDNAWRIPLRPVPAKEPASTKNRFLRGAIALAVNGIPIFNPLNNRGEDALAIGELDDYGGHCGRADDYHYHVAPLHLEKIVGKGMPIAYALDGYPVYGSTEPDGSPMKPLDACGGHEDGTGGYHYHALEKYPYLIGAFHGEVTEREGQVDPQPRAQPVRPALPPLRGATIVGFEATAPDTRKLVYEVSGRKGSVEYTVAGDGSAQFTFIDPSGRRTTESYASRPRGGGGPGGGAPRPERGPPRPGPGPGPGGSRPGPGQPRQGDRTSMERNGPDANAESARLASRSIAVSSPAFAPGGALPAKYSCDGEGSSPPVAWQPGPTGTQSYALTLWHRSPDGVKSYWVVYDIPADVTQIPEGARSVGRTGLNGKRRAEYDPMCSKGPGVKDYHVTVYALSGRPQVAAGEATREALLEAIDGLALAEGTLTFSFERGARP
jgi:phosphatidylethanolamine-binding protein (PEBP) family uncharacterized protein